MSAVAETRDDAREYLKAMPAAERRAFMNWVSERRGEINVLADRVRQLADRLQDESVTEAECDGIFDDAARIEQRCRAVQQELVHRERRVTASTESGGNPSPAGQADDVDQFEAVSP